MKTKILSILLIAVLLIGLVPCEAFAAEPVKVTFGMYEGYVYEGGIFDVRVNVDGPGAENATFRWQADVSFGGTGSWSDLKDNSAWHGTRTDHLQLYTHKGVLYGTGWEDIYFRCLVTVNGKSYSSPEFNMQVLPAGTLLSVLRKKEEGFKKEYGVGVEGYEQIFAESAEGFVTSATAYAGSELTFTIDATDPARTYFSDFQRSDVRFVPEIVVKEGDKVVQKGTDRCTYTPGTVGKTITVEHTLRVVAGITDHGVYQTNKMTIRILEPATTGIATVKYDCSLLKEMYTASKKLLDLSKGDTVAIVENIGNTWCKVLCSKTVGYLPIDALDTDRQIDTVSVSLPDYWADQIVPDTAQSGGNGYEVVGLTWQDETDGHTLKPDEKLRSDRMYTVLVRLQANDGFKFAVNAAGRSTVSAKIGKAAADVNPVPGQEPAKMLELSMTIAPVPEPTHTCKPTLVARVEPTCTTDGHEAYYRCDCGKTYTDKAGTDPCDPKTEGVLAAKDHTPGDWKYNGTHHYRKCEVCYAIVPGTNAQHKGSPCIVCGFGTHVCKPEYVPMVDPTCTREGFMAHYLCSCGKAYADAAATQRVDLATWGKLPKLPHFPGGWTVNTTHHASLCAYCSQTIPDTTAVHNGSPCSVCGFADPHARVEIKSIAITNLTVPKGGVLPDYTVSVDSPAYEVNPNAQAYEYSVGGISWYDITAGEFLPSNTSFLKGHEYQVYISLRPTGNNVFLYPYATINDEFAQISGSEYDVIVSYVFPPCGGRDTTGSGVVRP